jgi:hypothetical protein
MDQKAFDEGAHLVLRDRRSKTLKRKLGSATSRPLASSLQRRRRPAPTWISTLPRTPEVSTIWSTIYATPHLECGPHRAGQVARYKVGAENRLRDI